MWCQTHRSFYPVYLRPANLDHEVWTSEKACHLWALLPVFRPDPEKVGKQDPIMGDICRQERAELHSACMAFLRSHNTIEHAKNTKEYQIPKNTVHQLQLLGFCITFLAVRGILGGVEGNIAAIVGIC